ncbi:MAG TPA: hypothetical protein VHL05_07595, partial [Terriglobales bacterium]|nr:hypothetical protein [Terriglobales bacterium]
VAALLTSTISINTSPKLNSRTLRQPTCNMNPPLTRTSKPELLKANSYPPQFYLVILSEAKDPIPVRAVSAVAGNSLPGLLLINMPNLATRSLDATEDRECHPSLFSRASREHQWRSLFTLSS